MFKYPEFKSLNLPEIDQQILKFWEEEKIFEKSITTREGKTPFVFYEGPPSANGKPGIHHVLSRTLKDIFCRFKTLSGFQVNRKSGWDTHGLPIELSVEKTLGIKKEDIGKKISIEEYNKVCRQEVMKYKNIWEDLTRKMGYWVDLEHPYITYENNYIESLWSLLKKFYEKEYLYEGYTIQPYSPAAGTGLSSHELNQPGTYQTIRDTSVVAQFKVVRDSKSEFLFKDVDTDLFFLAWTTTPWTLPSNCALAVGEKITYTLVRTFNPYTSLPITVILAKDLVNKYFPEKNSEFKIEDYKAGDKELPFKIIDEVLGKDLEWINYEQLMPYVQPNGKAFVVITGDFVTTEDGTGIVHTASLFGADDFRVCKAKGIASVLVKDENGKEVPVVNLQGKFVKEISDFAGEYVKEQYYTAEEKEAERLKQRGAKYLSVDERIGIKLKKENKAFKVEKFEHSYPHCWRTDKPILYYPLDSWFIKVTACRDRLIELNKTINWKPESTGTGRFGNWLENVQDWNLSRSRFWGAALPIWRTEDGSEEICIGSIEELKTEIQKAIAFGIDESTAILVTEILENDKIDLHKPFVDDVILISKSGKQMRRVPDLIDVWFDSGAMPYAQWHFPFENEEKFKANFPADYIAEGIDQTRGWFYTLHVIAGMLFDSVAFKNVIANGLVLDKAGNKMSKRIGNVVEPFEVITQYGADATRWYLISNSQPWDNLKFDINGVDEVRRKLFGTLYNTYAFFALYANIDGFQIDSKTQIPVIERSEMDRWILSKLNSLIKSVTEYFQDYNPTLAARLIEEFVDRDLSNWYVRLSRRKFWKASKPEDEIVEVNGIIMSKDKRAAYETLFECLNVVSQIMSPAAPFFADWVYLNLNNNSDNHDSEKSSVHLTSLQSQNTDVIDLDLEERMDLAQRITSLIFSLRKKVNIKVRQPLQKILIPVSNFHFQDQIERMKTLILSEVNVKELDFLTNDAGFIKKKVKANFKVLGQRMGKNMKAVNEALLILDQPSIMELEKKGQIILVLNNESIEINANEVEIISEDIAGWQVANEGGLTVALDITLNEELRLEGNARELVNLIQKQRKELDFNVTDRIDVVIESSKEIKSLLVNYKNYICAEILADSFELADEIKDGTLLNLNDLSARIFINRKTP